MFSYQFYIDAQFVFLNYRCGFMIQEIDHVVQLTMSEPCASNIALSLKRFKWRISSSLLEYSFHKLID
ncbi:hypothetical protein T4B_12836 [Trichinella pseudospiralis]|uniref:Uncharacterized protein n=1 Tax=Trichinella pseudospiralis TaxID=6337 RepID=A0A0V1IQF9_TRIPS|nr:hypothetical protein T4B_12836 [Trichinella pseudospiralis]